jgi:hypothetical protein
MNGTMKRFRPFLREASLKLLMASLSLGRDLI